MSELGIKVCEALGLPANRVRDICINIPITGPAEAYIDMVMLDEKDTGWIDELKETAKVTIYVWGAEEYEKYETSH